MIPEDTRVIDPRELKARIVNVLENVAALLRDLKSPYVCSADVGRCLNWNGQFLFVVDRWGASRLPHSAKLFDLVHLLKHVRPLLENAMLELGRSVVGLEDLAHLEKFFGADDPLLRHKSLLQFLLERR